jgi:hypothetical protein
MAMRRLSIMMFMMRSCAQNRTTISQVLCGHRVKVESSASAVSLLEQPDWPPVVQNIHMQVNQQDANAQNYNSVIDFQRIFHFMNSSVSFGIPKTLPQ